MMYLFWFVEFLFELLMQPFRILESIFTFVLVVFDSVLTLVTVFPNWLSIPFIALISIAIIFRVSQFIPTIGGASNS